MPMLYYSPGQVRVDRYYSSAAGYGDPAWKPAAPPGGMGETPRVAKLGDTQAFICGGFDSTTGTAKNTSFAYSRLTNSFTTKANLPIALQGHRAVRIPDGRVIVCGGHGNTSNPIASTYIYDPSTNTWTNGPSMPKALLWHVAGLLDDGRIWVATGNDGTQNVNEAWTLNPQSMTWAQVASLPASGRNRAQGGPLPGNRAFVSGGATVPGNDFYIYNASTNSWGSGPSMPNYRSDGTSALVGLTLVIVGGFDGATNNPMPAYLFDTPSNAWSVGAVEPTKTSGDGAELGGMVFYWGTSTISVRIAMVYWP